MQLASAEPPVRAALRQTSSAGSSPRPAASFSPVRTPHGQRSRSAQALALAAGAAACTASAACAAGRGRRPSTRVRLRALPGSTWGAGAGSGGRPLRVIISGGGPGGLALACGLASTQGLDVRILEGRPYERPGAKNRGRSHTIGLGRRAREALIQLGGEELWQEMAAAGVMAEGFTLHLNGVPLSLPPPEGEPVVLLDRGRIVSSLRDRLASMEFAEGTDVRIDYGTKVKSVDVVHRSVTVRRQCQSGGTEQEEQIEYDLLIGSDGVRSRVREAMNSQLPPGRFESELRVMPGRWQVLHLDLPEHLNERGVHAMVSSEAPFGLFCIPDAAGPHCVIVSWSSDDAPEELLEAQTPEMLEAVLLRYFPQLGKIPREAAESFLAAKPSKAVVSRCRPLHDADHALCVLGDAAHAVGGGSLGQGCSAALQDAAALATCLQEGARLRQALLGPTARSAPFEEWSQGREEALVSSIAAFSEQRADEGWALLDLIELQSAAEVRASALVQGPLVFGFFLEQLGRGTLKPLADIGGRLLEDRLQRNQQSSAEEVKQFVTHLQFKPTMKFSPGVLVFLWEQAVLELWKFILDLFSRLQPPMQTALMATDESYAQLVGRNQTWLALLRSARAAAGVTRISCVRSLHAFSNLQEEESALWAQNFTVQERLQDDVLLRQSSPVNQQCFFGIRTGTCKVYRGGDEVATLEAGDCFGEACLVLGVPSPVTVKAASDVTLLVMKGEAFCSLMARAEPELRKALEVAAERYGASFEEVVAEQEQGRQRVRRLLETVVSVEDAHGNSHRHHSAVDLDHLLGTVGIESYSNGDLVALGCQRLRVLEQGNCKVVRGGRQVRSLEAGDFFGPDLAADERVVACSDEVRVCSFTNEGQTSIGFLLNSRTS